LSGDGKIFMCVSEEEPCKIYLNNTKTRKVCYLEGHTSSVTCLVLLEDGSLAASASNDDTIRIWNLVTCKCVMKLTISRPCFTILLTSNGKTLISFSFDNVLRVWNTQTGGCIRVIEEFIRWQFLYSLLLSPNEREIVTMESDGTVRIWDIKRFICKEVISFGKDSRALLKIAYL